MSQETEKSPLQGMSQDSMTVSSPEDYDALLQPADDLSDAHRLTGSL
jgi:hypothetical protein